MIYVYGADPFSNSPSSQVLLKELLKAGFKRSEITHAKLIEDITDDSYVISFGAPSFKELTGLDASLKECAGMLCCMDTNHSVFVFPTYSPGYLYHNPREKETWKQQLELFYAVIKTDQGILV